ncbi:hypothetical protein [Azospirillum doebereinerae]
MNRNQPSRFSETILLPTAAAAFALPVLKPSLLWASIPDSFEATEQDRTDTPATYLILKRLKSWNESPLGLAAFWEEMQHSRTVLILDPHLDDAAMLRLYEKIKIYKMEFDDFRIITGEEKAKAPFRLLQKYFVERKINSFCEIVAKKMRYRTKSKINNYINNKGKVPFDELHIHDRFVLTDRELWHFGGSVGCLQDGMTAASRGWSDEETKFSSFFHEIWKALGGRAL